MKKLALLLYPEFSIQEVADVMFLFRWGYQIKTTTFALTKQCVCGIVRRPPLYKLFISRNEYTF